jgi:hypothetical protein
MAVMVNGKDMKVAVMKMDQFEMRLLELTPDGMRVSVKDTSGEAFTFVPRFMSISYPDTKVVNARDTGIATVPAKQLVEVTVQFAEKIHMERMMSFELRYARKRLAEISIE